MQGDSKIVVKVVQFTEAGILLFKREFVSENDVFNASFSQ